MPKNFVRYKSNIRKILGDLEKYEISARNEAGAYMVKKIKAKLNKKRKSQPGEPPGRYSGNLRKGIKRATGKYETLVGVKKPAYHAQLLELGTDKMRARPFLIPTFMEELEAIKNILSKPRL